MMFRNCVFRGRRALGRNFCTSAEPTVARKQKSRQKHTRQEASKSKKALQGQQKTKPQQLPSPANHPPLLEIVKSQYRWSKEPELRRRFFDELGKFWGFESLDRWYTVRTDDIMKAPSGSTLINNRFNGSFPRALADAYPEHNWIHWKFTRLPRSVVFDPTLQRSFFDWAGKILDISEDSLARWYSVTALQLEEIGGSFIGSVFKSNLAAALKAAYPNHEWLPWMFRSVPRMYWRSTENQREFADWYMREKLQGSDLELWYNASTLDIRKNGGHGWIKTHKHSFVRALKHVYPEHVFYEWKFKHVPTNFWSAVENRRQYFFWLGEQLGFTKLEEYYQLRIIDFDRNHGRGLLYSRYGDKISRAIVDSIPEHTWDPEKFRSSS